MNSKEIFIGITRKIGFQYSQKENNVFYSVLGNTLVIMSNQCIELDAWDDYLERHPKYKSMNLVNFVFEDSNDTYSPECLTIKRQREVPLTVDEYVYKSSSITETVLEQIIEGLRLMDLNNRYDDSTGLMRKYVRHSINP